VAIREQGHRRTDEYDPTRFTCIDCRTRHVHGTLITLDPPAGSVIDSLKTHHSLSAALLEQTIGFRVLFSIAYYYSHALMDRFSLDSHYKKYGNDKRFDLKGKFINFI
jgi:hypothetical protein